MSTLSDVQDLYGSLRGVWAKSQAHVASHIMVLVVIFLICGVSIPWITIPEIDATQIIDNGWFKLAKDTGLIYVVLVVPFVAVAVYGVMFRMLGLLLVMTLMHLIPPTSRRNRFHFLNSSALEPLALLVGKEDFVLGDLTEDSLSSP
jgi:hypothetical protein